MKFFIGLILACCMYVPAQAQNSFWYYQSTGNCRTPVFIPVPVRTPVRPSYRYYEPDPYAVQRYNYMNYNYNYGNVYRGNSPVSYNRNYVEPAYVEPLVIENPFFKK